MTPATSAAQNGWRKTFALTLATPRRRMAPAAALTNISAAGTECSTPKISASATAPAAAAKSHAGTGGAREIAAIACAAASGASRPAPSSSMTRAADATRSMSTPVIGRHLGDLPAVLVLGLKLQFSPARHDLGAQSERAAELLGRGYGLLGGLAVDVEQPGEGEDKVGMLRRRHGSFSQSAYSKAASSLESWDEPREPRPTEDMTTLNAAPWAMLRSPRRASPFFSDRRRDRIPPP